MRPACCILICTPALLKQLRRLHDDGQFYLSPAMCRCLYLELMLGCAEGLQTVQCVGLFEVRINVSHAESCNACNSFTGLLLRIKGVRG